MLRIIVALAPLKVRPVVELVFQMPPPGFALVRFHVPEPIVRLLVLLLLDAKAAEVVQVTVTFPWNTAPPIVRMRLELDEAFPTVKSSVNV